MMKARLNPVDLAGIVLVGLVVVVVVVAAIFVVSSQGAVGWDVRPGNWLSEETEQRLDGEIRHVTVRNISGNIEISGWDGDDILVQYTRSAPTADALENLYVDIDRQAEGVSIERKTKRRLIGQSGHVAFTIRLPAHVVALSAQSVSGSIEVAESVTATSQELKTVSGPIETKAIGDLSASSTSGAVDFVFDGGVLAVKTVSGRISGEIANLDEQARISIGSVSGRISLQAFEELDATVELSSVSGTIRNQFPTQITRQTRNKLTGVIGNGSVPFGVSTTSGAIDLNKR